MKTLINILVGTLFFVIFFFVIDFIIPFILSFTRGKKNKKNNIQELVKDIEAVLNVTVLSLWLKNDNELWANVLFEESQKVISIRLMQKKDDEKLEAYDDFINGMDFEK